MKKISFHHLAINVSDLNLSTEFYTEILGFQKGISFTSSDRATKIQYLHGHNMAIELTSRFFKLAPFKKKIKESQIKHLAFLVDDIKAQYKHLKKK